MSIKIEIFFILFAEGNLLARTTEPDFTELKPLAKNMNKMASQIDLLIKKNIEEEKNFQKAEMKALQAQITPHFLYNTLDIIQYLAKENKPDDVTYLIKNLSKFYKISLHNKSDFVKIESEIKHISYYTAIENFKHDNAIKLEIDIPSEIQNLSIPKITFQPIVENAIKHGILEKDVPEGYIRIWAKKEGCDVLIFIEDNGAGMPQSRIDEILSQKTSSVGIMNTDKRLKLFFGEAYGLSFESEVGKFTRVIIKIRGTESKE